MNVYTKFVFVLLVGLATGCASQVGFKDRESQSMARAVRDGTQFGPSVNAIFDSVNDIGNTGGCGSTRKYNENSDPIISKAADVTNKNGGVTYEYAAGTSGVGKCVER